VNLLAVNGWDIESIPGGAIASRPGGPLLSIQPAATPLKIKADPLRKHWAIGPDGRLYRYAPP